MANINKHHSNEWRRTFGNIGSGLLKDLGTATRMSLSDMAPGTFGAISSSAQVMRDARESVSQMRTQVTQQGRALKRTLTGRDAARTINDAFNDIREGTFDMGKITGEAYDTMDYFDSQIDQYDMDMANSDDPDMLAMTESKKNTALIGRAITQGNAATIEGLDRMTTTLANVQMKATDAQTKQLQQIMLTSAGQTNAKLLGISSKIDAVNSNLMAIMDFHRKNTAILNKSTMEYQKSTTMMLGQIGQGMAEIRDFLQFQRDLIEKQNQPQHSARKRSQLFDFSSGFNASDYVDMVKKNFKTSSVGLNAGMYSMMLPMMMMGGESPIAMAMSMVLPNLIPSNMRKSIGRFDKSISHGIDNALRGLGRWRNSSNDFKKMIGEIFGIREESLFKGIDTSNFKKDSMGWNGIAQKTLVEVIPGYLARIESALTKQDERFFDMEKGKFRTRRSLEREYKETHRNALQWSANDLTDQVKRMVGGDTANRERIMDAVSALYMRALRDPEHVDMRATLRQIEQVMKRSNRYGTSGGFTNKEIHDVQRAFKDAIGSAKNDIRDVQDMFDAAGAYRNLFNEEGRDTDHLHNFGNVFAERREFVRNNTSWEAMTSFEKEKYKKEHDKWLEAERKRSSSGDNSEYNWFYFQNEVDKEVNKYFKKLGLDKLAAKANRATNAVSGKIDSASDWIYSRSLGSADSADISFVDDLFKKSGDKALFTNISDATTAGIARGLRASGGNKEIVSRLDKIVYGVQSMTNIMRNGFFGSSKGNRRRGRHNVRSNTRRQQSRVNQTIHSTTNNLNDVVNMPTSQIEHDARETNAMVSTALVPRGNATMIHESDEDDEAGPNNALMERMEDNENSLKALVVSLNNNFLKPVIGGIFGKDGFFRRIFTNDTVKKFIKSLFDEDEGVFGSVTSWAKERKAGLRHLIDGKGFTRRDGTEVASNRAGSLFGKISSGYHFVRSNTMKYLFGDDYANNETYQKYLSWTAGKSGDNIAGFNIDDDNAGPGAIGAAVNDITDELAEKGSKIVEATVGGDDAPKKIESSYKKASQSFMQKMKEFLPVGLAGAGIGAAVGFSTMLHGTGLLGGLFLPGGPVGGAVLGIAGSLLSRSEKFKDFLFGKEDDNGKRVGGIITEKQREAFKKSLPLVVGSATVGAITSIAKGAVGLGGNGLLFGTLLPGGPLGGAILGLGMGLLKNNDRFNEILWGKQNKDGTRGKGILTGANSMWKKVMESSGDFIKGGAGGILAGLGTGFALSKMGILGGALAAGGPVMWGLTGLGIGIASQTEKFKALLFGDKDEEGHRTGDGLLSKAANMLSINVFEPIRESLQYHAEDFAYFLKKNISYPFREAFGPIADSLHTIKVDIKDAIRNAFNNIATTVSGAFKIAIKDLFGPITSGIGKLGKGAVSVATTGLKFTLLPVSGGLNLLKLMTGSIRNRARKDEKKTLLSFEGLRTMLGGAWDEAKARNAAIAEEGGFGGPLGGLNRLATFGLNLFGGFNTAWGAAKQGYRDEMAAQGFNSLGWRSVDDERKALRKQRKKALKDRKQWNQIGAISRDLAAANGYANIKLSEAGIDDFKARLRREHIDESIINAIETSDDINELVYHRGDFKNRLLKGEEKEQIPSQQAQFYNTMEEYMKPVYQYFTKQALEQSLAKKKKISVEDMSKMNARLRAVGLKWSDLGYNVTEKLDFGSLSDDQWDAVLNDLEWDRGAAGDKKTGAKKIFEDMLDKMSLMSDTQLAQLQADHPGEVSDNDISKVKRGDTGIVSDKLVKIKSKLARYAGIQEAAKERREREAAEEAEAGEGATSFQDNKKKEAGIKDLKDISVGELAKNTMKKGFDLLGSLFSSGKFWAAIGIGAALLPFVLKPVKAILSTLWNKLLYPHVIKPIGEHVKKFFTKTVPEWFGKVVDFIKEEGPGLLAKVLDGLELGLVTVGEYLTKATMKIADWIIEKVKEFFTKEKQEYESLETPEQKASWVTKKAGEGGKKILTLMDLINNPVRFVANLIARPIREGLFNVVGEKLSPGLANFGRKASKVVSIVTNPIGAAQNAMFNKAIQVGNSGLGQGPGMMQSDPRWGNMPIGIFPNGQVSTMATGGCGPTALSMIAEGFGPGTSPIDVANYAMQNGMISGGGATADLFTKGASDMGLQSHALNKGSLREAIGSGQPIIVSGKSAGNGPYTSAGHIVAIHGTDARGNAIVGDPMRGTRSVPIDQLTSGMTHGWSYSNAGYGNGPVGYGTLGMVLNAARFAKYLVDKKSGSHGGGGGHFDGYSAPASTSSNAAKPSTSSSAQVKSNLSKYIAGNNGDGSYSMSSDKYSGGIGATTTSKSMRAYLAESPSEVGIDWTSIVNPDGSLKTNSSIAAQIQAGYAINYKENTYAFNISRFYTSLKVADLKAMAEFHNIYKMTSAAQAPYIHGNNGDGSYQLSKGSNSGASISYDQALTNRQNSEKASALTKNIKRMSLATNLIGATRSLINGGPIGVANFAANLGIKTLITKAGIKGLNYLTKKKRSGYGIGYGNTGWDNRGYSSSSGGIGSAGVKGGAANARTHVRSTSPTSNIGNLQTVSRREALTTDLLTDTRIPLFAIMYNQFVTSGKFADDHVISANEVDMYSGTDVNGNPVDANWLMGLGGTGWEGDWAYKYGFPFYHTTDDRWGDRSWRGANVAQRGSDLASLAMVATAFSGNHIHPAYILDNWIKENPDWLDSSGGLNMETVFSNNGSGFNAMGATQKDGKRLGVQRLANSSSVLSALQANKPVVMTGRRNPNSIFSGGVGVTGSADDIATVVGRSSNGAHIAILNPHSTLEQNDVFSTEILKSMFGPDGADALSAYAIMNPDGTGIDGPVDMASLTGGDRDYVDMKKAKGLAKILALFQNIAAVASHFFEAALGDGKYRSIFDYNKIEGDDLNTSATAMSLIDEFGANGSSGSYSTSGNWSDRGGPDSKEGMSNNPYASSSEPLWYISDPAGYRQVSSSNKFTPTVIARTGNIGAVGYNKDGPYYGIGYGNDAPNRGYSMSRDNSLGGIGVKHTGRDLSKRGYSDSTSGMRSNIRVAKGTKYAMKYSSLTSEQKTIILEGKCKSVKTDKSMVTTAAQSQYLSGNNSVAKYYVTIINVPRVTELGPRMVIRFDPAASTATSRSWDARINVAGQHGSGKISLNDLNSTMFSNAIDYANGESSFVPTVIHRTGNIGRVGYGVGGNRRSFNIGYGPAMVPVKKPAMVPVKTAQKKVSSASALPSAGAGKYTDKYRGNLKDRGYSSSTSGVGGKTAKFTNAADARTGVTINGIETTPAEITELEANGITTKEAYGSDSTGFTSGYWKTVEHEVDPEEVWKKMTLFEKLNVITEASMARWMGDSYEDAKKKIILEKYAAKYGFYGNTEEVFVDENGNEISGYSITTSDGTTYADGGAVQSAGTTNYTPGSGGVDMSGVPNITNMNEAYSILAGLNLAQKKNNFFHKVLKGSLASKVQDGVLPSITLSQAAIESGWGESGLTTKANNLFGIKAGSSWTGATIDMNTGEQRADGSRYTTLAKFRAYNNWDESIADHGQFLKKPRYAKVISASNYSDAAYALKEAGYATSLDYPKTLIGTIEANRLYSFDKFNPSAASNDQINSQGVIHRTGNIGRVGYGRGLAAIGYGGKDWMSVVKTVKQQLASTGLGYSQSGYVMLNINGNAIRVRRDCSGFVSACVTAYTGRIFNCTSSSLCDTNSAQLILAGFTRLPFPGWDQLKEGDILCKHGHTEIYAGTGHMVYSCGSDRSIRNPGPGNSGSTAYEVIWRPAFSGMGTADALMQARAADTENMTTVGTPTIGANSISAVQESEEAAIETKKLSAWEKLANVLDQHFGSSAIGFGSPQSYFSRTLGGGLTAGYGPSRSPLGNYFHRGIDIGAAYGRPVTSPVSGTVVASGYDPAGYGNYTVVQDRAGNAHVFGHMGQTVGYGIGTAIGRGMPLGTIGMTGNTTGPHLHYEIRKNGSAFSTMDPTKFNYKTLSASGSGMKVAPGSAVGGNTAKDFTAEVRAAESNAKNTDSISKQMGNVVSLLGATGEGLGNNTKSMADKLDTLITLWQEYTKISVANANAQLAALKSGNGSSEKKEGESSGDNKSGSGTKDVVSTNANQQQQQQPASSGATQPQQPQQQQPAGNGIGYGIGYGDGTNGMYSGTAQNSQSLSTLSSYHRMIAGK